MKGERLRVQVSVCSPVHNEEQNLPGLVADIAAVMRPLYGSDWEQVLVDDGSSDGSARRMRELQDAHPELRCASHPTNLGERAAWQTAFEQARGEILVMLAADRQNDPHDIPRLIEPVRRGRCDCCTGARARRKDGLYFSAATLVLTGLFDLGFGLRVRDVSSSFFAVRTSLLRGLRLEENDHRYILAILRRRGATMREIGTWHRPRQRGRSHYSRWKVVRAVPEVLRFAARCYRGLYDQPDR